MTAALDDPRVQRVLRLPEQDEDLWRSDLERFQRGDLTLTRQSAGEGSIKAAQRLLIFLGYSTASTGAFSIDGNFGRGTNRAVAQFQYEHGLTRTITRAPLCYACTWQTASANIVEIPNAKLTPATLDRMLSLALESIEKNEVMCGTFDEAIFHLDALHRRTLLSCRAIEARYGQWVDDGIAEVAAEGIDIVRNWILSIIKQETGGIVRPRFEQHLLTRFEKNEPKADFVDLRFRSMSMGVGQVLGDNYRRVGAKSARAMYLSPIAEQVAQIARFLASSASVADVVSRSKPKEADFRAVARYYNGPGYEKHHYHESLAAWFREFDALRAAAQAA